MPAFVAGSATPPGRAASRPSSSSRPRSSSSRPAQLLLPARAVSPPWSYVPGVRPSDLYPWMPPGVDLFEVLILVWIGVSHFRQAWCSG